MARTVNSSAGMGRPSVIGADRVGAQAQRRVRRDEHGDEVGLGDALQQPADRSSCRSASMTIMRGSCPVTASRRLPTSPGAKKLIFTRRRRPRMASGSAGSRPTVKTCGSTGWLIGGLSQRAPSSSSGASSPRPLLKRSSDPRRKRFCVLARARPGALSERMREMLSRIDDHGRALLAARGSEEITVGAFAVIVHPEVAHRLRGPRRAAPRGSTPKVSWPCAASSRSAT